MKVLLASPTAYPVGGEMRYGGIERLVWLWAKELARCGQNVTLLAPTDGKGLPGISVIETPQSWDIAEGERTAFLLAWPFLRGKDLVLDFTHEHLLARESKVGHISWIWHDPYIMRTATPNINVAALSQWQAERFQRTTGQKAKVIDCHVVSHEYAWRDVPCTGRVLSIGKMHPTKGHLAVALACREAGLALDVVGPVTPGDDPAYAAAVEQALEGTGGCYHGEVSEEKKLELLRSATVMAYYSNYPEGKGEAHSMKTVEALCCGLPVVARDQGAAAEVINAGGVWPWSAMDQTVTGQTVQCGYWTGGDVAVPENFSATLRHRVESRERLNRRSLSWQFRDRWAVENVVARMQPVMEAVAGGERW